MSERRKPSTRYRGEPPPKRRFSTPAQPQSKPPKIEPAAVIEVEEGLPTKLKDGGPLPTLIEPQGPNLPVGSFQDIAGSGVLAASVTRSRQRWLIDGVFEKYWTKVSKKKAQAEVQNPAKESMTKLGVCSMIIEPHVFETTLYSVRENQYTFMPPVGQTVYPVQSPAGPASSPYGAGSPPSHHHTTPSLQPKLLPQRQPPTNIQQPILPPFREGFARFEPAGPPLPSPSSLVNSRDGLPHASQESSSTVHTGGKGVTSQTDPVIQMLASRAAADHGLKSLMKVVASGKASQLQLQTFQNKLNELNEIIQKNPLQTSSFEGTSMSDNDDTKKFDKASPQEGPTGKSTLTNLPAPLPPRDPIKTEPLSSYYSQPLPIPKPKVSAPVRQDIKAVVFDFTGGTGDRFLFPKHSILEYLPGNTQVLASFLITRTGNLANSTHYKPGIEYYQPVTIRMSSHNPRTLEQLAKVVAPADEVRAHMSETMAKMLRAEDGYLALRLPRGGNSSSSNSNSNEVVASEMKELSLQPNYDLPRRTYSPPNSLLPLYAAAKT